MIDIEKLFNTDARQLQVDEFGEVKAVIYDEEIDPLDCEFHNDDCVLIKTKRYTHITLSRRNLENLLDLIDEADEHFSK